MEAAIPQNYDIRLRIYNEHPAFGNGVFTLLSLVGEYGSIAKACEKMQMSPSKAWKIIRHSESDLGVRLLCGVSGGTHGGYTELTEEGRHLLESYRHFYAEVEKAADAAFGEYFGRGRRGSL